MLFRKKKPKKREKASQFMLGLGIALLLLNLPIYIQAYLVISMNNALAGMLVGILFVVAGVLVNMKR